MLFHLSKSEFDTLSKNDLRIFRNAIKYQYDSNWTSIVFEDGTKIQIKDEETSYGFIDRFGQVTEIIENNQYDILVLILVAVDSIINTA